MDLFGLTSHLFLQLGIIVNHLYCVIVLHAMPSGG